MTVGPRCTVTFSDRNKQLARLLGFALGEYVGFEMKPREYEATRPSVGQATYFLYTFIVTW